MMRSCRFIVLLALALSAVAAGAASAAGLRATLEVDRAWLAAEDDVVAAVTITNDSARTMVVPRWQVPGARLEADLFHEVRRAQPDCNDEAGERDEGPEVRRAEAGFAHANP